MAEYNARIKHKRDTDVNWADADPVLLNGEIIVVDTTDGHVRKKVGDGTQRYSHLPFDDEQLAGVVQSLTNAQKEQARANIGAGMPLFVVNVEEPSSDVFTADKTAAEIEAAYQTGCEIVCRMDVPILGMGVVPMQMPLKSRRAANVFSFAVDQTMWDNDATTAHSIVVTITSSGINMGYNSTNIYSKPGNGIPKTDLANSVQTSLAKADSAVQSLPEALKNPNALTFTGDVTASYDGSEAKTINIPTVPTSLKNPYALSIMESGVAKTYDGSAAQSITIPPAVSTAVTLPASGTALADNTVYIAPIAIATYTFTPPAASHGWAHGIFSVGNSPNIAFTGKILGKLPTFESGKRYEFDVFNSIWIVQEVMAQ